MLIQLGHDGSFSRQHYSSKICGAAIEEQNFYTAIYYILLQTLILRRLFDTAKKVSVRDLTYMYIAALTEF